MTISICNSNYMRHQSNEIRWWTNLKIIATKGNVGIQIDFLCDHQQKNDDEIKSKEEEILKLEALKSQSANDI